MGTPAGGPGGEAEEYFSCGSANGAHTIPNRQRQGKVFDIYNCSFSFFNTHKFLDKSHKHTYCNLVQGWNILLCICYDSPPEQKRLNSCLSYN